MTIPLRRAVPFMGASALITIPCFWQRHLVNCDLGSHAYNAWLSLLIERGEVTDLYLAPQWSNILFDLILANLMRLLSPDASQQVAACIAVLAFFWGGFVLISRLSGRPAWPVAPLLATFTYGVVFHIGFFNYFLGLGLCFIAITMTLRRSYLSIAASLPIWIVASTAHTLSLAWGMAAVALLLLMENTPNRFRLYIVVGFIALLAIATLLLSFAVPTSYRGSGADMFGFTQLMIFGFHNIPAAAAAAILIGVSLGSRLQSGPLGHTLLTPPACLYYLCCAIVLASPDMVVLPGVAQNLSILALRMALPAAIALLAWWNSSLLSPGNRLAAAVIAIVYFALLYRDHRSLSDFEQRLHAAVRRLPSGSRVVSRFQFPTFVDFGEHMIDRACIGHCWSYLNYEPASRAFRVRTFTDSRTAIPSTGRLAALRSEGGPLSPEDLPLQLVQPALDRPGEFTVQALSAGEQLPRLSRVSLRSSSPDK